MTDGARRVLCATCNTTLIDWSLDEVGAEREPCPECGSTSRLVDLHLESTTEVHSMLALKAKSPGERKPFVEQKIGDDLFRKTGRWSRLSRLIDRRGNRYVEHIEDAETGDVRRHIEESLSEHRGRGSDKPKR